MKIGRRGVAIAAVCLGFFGGWARAGTASTPVIGSLSPSAAGIEGGEEVAVFGSGFTPGVVVAVGDAVATDVTVDDASHLRFRVPRQKAPGLRTLTVRTPDGFDQAWFRVVPKPLADLAPCEITTVAGGLGTVGDGAYPGTSFIVMAPQRVALDADRNVYVADPVNQRVRRIEHGSRRITTVAGCGRAGFEGDGGQAVTATLSGPSGIAVDGAGNLFIADTVNERVRRVDAVTGVITTIAGTGEEGFSGDGGPAAEAALDRPVDVAVDAAGNVLVSDAWNGRVRRIDAATGTIATVAGGPYGSPDPMEADGGPATEASLFPEGICLDAAGNLFVADNYNHRVRRVDAATGIITTVAGGGSAPNPVEGPATEIYIEEPWDVAVAGDGTLYLVDGHPEDGDYSAGGVVREVDTSGWMSLLEHDEVNFASGLALDDASNLYIADPDDGLVRVINSSSDLLSTLAGSGALEPVGASVGVPPTEATLDSLTDLDVTPDGDVYVLQSRGFGDYRVLRAGRDSDVLGQVQLDPGSGFLRLGTALAVDPAGDVFTADDDGFSTLALIRRTAAGKPRTKIIAGGGTRAPQPGLPGRRVDLGFVQHLVADGTGHVYALVANAGPLRLDAKTGRIEKIFGGYGGAIAVDAEGTLYASSTVTVARWSGGRYVPVAGNGSEEVSGDGGPATLAGLGHVVDIAVDRGGNLYILDRTRVRRVDAATGIITTVAGGDAAGYTGDAGPAASATLDTPVAIAVDGDGNVYIATRHGTVRAIKAGCRS